VDCKRHTGKPFSTQDTLNSHLHRVHREETDGDSLREEVKTLKRENQQLKGQFDVQGAQFVEMERQIMQLQQAHGLA
jgi:predicted  nucleic acid-binding Zn-ribbon protein